MSRLIAALERTWILHRFRHERDRLLHDEALAAEKAYDVAMATVVLTTTLDAADAHRWIEDYASAGGANRDWLRRATRSCA